MGTRPTVLTVGAENGISVTELTLFSAAGFVPVSLGDAILRATTATIAAVVIVGGIFPS